jgi:hypothetical protein
MLESVTENFGASFQENQFEVNKVISDSDLQRSMKDKVCQTNPHSLSAVTFQQLPKKNTICRYTECTQSGRQQFQHLL